MLLFHSVPTKISRSQNRPRYMSRVTANSNATLEDRNCQINYLPLLRSCPLTCIKFTVRTETVRKLLRGLQIRTAYKQWTISGHCHDTDRTCTANVTPFIEPTSNANNEYSPRGTWPRISTAAFLCLPEPNVTSCAERHVIPWQRRHGLNAIRYHQSKLVADVRLSWSSRAVRSLYTTFIQADIIDRIGLCKICAKPYVDHAKKNWRTAV